MVAVPLLIGIYLSFTDYTPILPTFGWAGLTNYVNIIHNAQVHVVINNTVIYAGAGIVIRCYSGWAWLYCWPGRSVTWPSSG